MAQAEQQQEGQSVYAEARPQQVIPISEPSEVHRRIPRAVFIDNVEAWVDKYGDDPLFQQMNELYQKYKFMENQLVRQKDSLKQKLPEIKRSLEMVAMLQQKAAGENKEVDTNFLVSDNIWAKAKVPNDTGKVGLWLGANVMVEYTFADAMGLLGKNLANAEQKLAETVDDYDYLKDQLTTIEVNMARVYNQGLANKKAADDRAAVMSMAQSVAKGKAK